MTDKMAMRYLSPVKSLMKKLDFDRHYIEALDFAVKNLKERPQEWIPVSERLPEVHKAVLVWCPEHRNIFCASCDDYGEWNIFGAYCRVHDEVIAWMPLPEPYKEAENEI
jgi:hypothetical protein